MDSKTHCTISPTDSPSRAPCGKINYAVRDFKHKIRLTMKKEFLLLLSNLKPMPFLQWPDSLKIFSRSWNAKLVNIFQFSYNTNANKFISIHLIELSQYRALLL